ncbi:hypothetical protein B4U80_14626, partial [Leptotrombidium deliense]
ASLEQILYAVKLSAVGTYFDDYIDNNCGDENMLTKLERVKAIFKGENIEPENLAEKLSKEIYMEALTLFDEEQQICLRRKTGDFIRSYMWQKKLKRQKRTPEIGEYIALRGYTVTNDLWFEGYEYVGHINLPLIAKCDQSVTNMAILTNQISWQRFCFTRKRC